ncbi:MAG: hypothetical protein PUB22_06265 [Clostridiales bacterium]|nr:hypothetical protein [Clostridiales bacterium]
MEGILQKLSEIEDAANRILDRTAEQKAKLTEEMRVRTENFDKDQEEKKQKRILEIQESLQGQREETLKELQVSTEKQMQQLKSLYEERHQELADILVSRILEE